MYHPQTTRMRPELPVSLRQEIGLPDSGRLKGGFLTMLSDGAVNLTRRAGGGAAVRCGGK